MTNDDQLNESNLLFILIFNLQDTIVYNEFTIFTSQLSSVQIPTNSAAHLSRLVRYFMSPITLLPITKQDTSYSQLIYLNGVPDLFDYLLTKLESDYSKKGREKMHGAEEAYETYPPKMIFKGPFFFIFFCHFFSDLIMLSTAKVFFEKRKKYKTRHPLSLVSPPCNYFDHVGGYQDISGKY